MKNTAVDGKIVKTFLLWSWFAVIFGQRKRNRNRSRSRTKPTNRTVFDGVASSPQNTAYRDNFRVIFSPFLIFSKYGTRYYCDLLPCIFTSDVCVCRMNINIAGDVDEIDVLAVEEMKCGKKLKRKYKKQTKYITTSMYKLRKYWLRN